MKCRVDAIIEVVDISVGLRGGVAQVKVKMDAGHCFRSTGARPYWPEVIVQLRIPQELTAPIMEYVDEQLRVALQPSLVAERPRVGSNGEGESDG